MKTLKRSCGLYFMFILILAAFIGSSVYASNSVSFEQGSKTKSLKVMVDLHYDSRVDYFKVSNYSNMTNSSGWLGTKGGVSGVQWNLLSGNSGYRTVYVLYKDGNTVLNSGKPYTAKIYYEKPAPADKSAPTGGITIDSKGIYNGNKVDLKLTVRDNVSKAEKIQMKLSNDSDFSNNKWMGFKSNFAGFVLDDKGTNSVYVQFKDESGNVSGTYRAETKAKIAPTPAPTPTPKSAPAPQTSLTAPTGLAITSTTNSSITLKWNKVTNATGYMVYRSQNPTLGFELLQTTVNTTIVDSLLATGQIYYYKVAAVSDSKTSEFSKVVSGKATDLPSTPRGLTVKSKTSSSATLKWDAVSGATGYELYRSLDSGKGFTKVQSTTSTSVTNKGLTDGKTYYYKIVAVNSSGKSAQSSSVKVQVPVDPEKAKDRLRDLVVEKAKLQLGSPYKYGSDGPNTFDCSGLTQYSYKLINKKIPRTSKEQSKFGMAVKKSQLKKGDLLFFDGGDGVVNHVGMYIGGGKMIHAPQTGDVVRIVSLSSRHDFHSARRVIY